MDKYGAAIFNIILPQYMYDDLILDKKDYFKECEDIFNEYPHISPLSIYERFLKDKENGIERIQWDVIPSEQYHNLLKRFMDMGEFARIPKNIVTEWFMKIKRNTVIFYYLTYMYHRIKGFPFEIIPFETDDYVKAQRYLLLESEFYLWARLKDGAPCWTDIGFDSLFPLIREYREDMTGEEILVLINKCIDVTHALSDMALAFIEGGNPICYYISHS